MIAEKAMSKPDISTVAANRFERLSGNLTHFRLEKNYQAKTKDWSPKKIVAHADVKLVAQDHKTGQAEERANSRKVVPYKLRFDSRKQIPSSK